MKMIRKYYKYQSINDKINNEIE